MNTKTTISCLKISSIIFATMATLLSLLIEFSNEIEYDPLTVFLICELIGYSFAFMIFAIAIIDGYVNSKTTINRYLNIPENIKKDFILRQKPLNPKYWFIQFEILQIKNGKILKHERTVTGSNRMVCAIAVSFVVSAFFLTFSLVSADADVHKIRYGTYQRNVKEHNTNELTKATK